MLQLKRKRPRRSNQNQNLKMTIWDSDCSIKKFIIALVIIKIALNQHHYQLKIFSDANLCKYSSRHGDLHNFASSTLSCIARRSMGIIWIIKQHQIKMLTKKKNSSLLSIFLSIPFSFLLFSFETSHIVSGLKRLSRYNEWNLRIKRVTADVG